nr:putative polyprotein [Tanacetum cinerariifolium]
MKRYLPRGTSEYQVSAVLTKSGQVLVNAAKQSSHRTATSVSAARRINTATSRPNVNNALLTTYSYFKSHSLVRRPFNQKSTAKTNHFNEKINSAKVNNVTTAGPKAVVSVVERNRNNVVNSLACWIWRPKGNLIDHISKDSRSYTLKRFNYVDPQGRLNGCCGHMTGNKSYLKDYHEIDGGFVAFGGNAKGGKITRKGYFINSKAFRVFNTRTRFVKENPHINFLENKQNVIGTGPNWMFDIDTLTMSMNFQPFFAGNLTNGNAGLKSSEDEVADDTGKKSTEVSRKENGVQDPLKEGKATNTNSTNKLNAVSSSFTTMDPKKERAQRNEFESMFGQDKDANGNSTYRMFTHVSAVGSSYVNLGGLIPVNAATLPNIDPLMPDLEDTTDLQDTGIFSGAYDDEVEGAVADFNNLELTTVFRLQKVWRLVDLPKGKHAIGTKWVYRNKKDERGIIVRNKARLVAQGYTQEEGIDYDEVFASIARIEAIMLFLAYASFIGFIVYQMDIKSAFLYGTIEKEVYVCQPPGFDDPHFPNKVYVDDIIFGSTKNSLCTEFEGLMHKKFQMSFMRELTFFLGLQVMQRNDRIFISQDKYVADILKKFNFSSVKTASTPIKTNKALLKDEEAEDVDVYLYRSMIGSLMYLTTSRPDIMFAIYACARFQVTPKVSNLYAVKRIFRYLKGQPKLGLWYPRDLPFDLEAFSDIDYAGASLDRKSTTREMALMMNLELKLVVAKVITAEKKLILNGCLDWNETAANDEIQFWATNKVKNVNGEAQIQALVDKKKVIITEALIKRDLRFEDEERVDCLSNEVIFEQPTLIGEGKDFSRKVTPLFQSMMKKQKSRRKQRKETEVRLPISEIPNEERLPTTSNDLLPSGEDRMQLNEVMILCTNLQKQKRKLKTLGLKRLRKVRSARRIESSPEASLGDQEDASKQGRMIDNLDQDVEITLVDDTQGRMNEEDMFGVNDIDGDEVVVDVSASEKVDQSVKVVEKEVSTADPVTTTSDVVTTVGIEVIVAATTLQISKDELTLAQTLIEIKEAKPKDITSAATTVTASTMPKEKGIVKQEPSETPSPKAIIFSQKPSQAKQRQGKNNYELAVRLQEEERRKLSIEEKSRLLVELMDKRKKHFARLRAKKIRSKPPTKAQRRNQMCTYLKNMANYKRNQLKNKSFEEIQMLFNNTINNLEQEDAKRQRIEEESESVELKRCIEIILEDDDDVKIEATPLSSKSLTIVDYKIYKKGGKAFSKSSKQMMYLFTRNILHQMWNDVRLQVDYEVEMAYDLLRLIRKQINEGYVPE